MLSEWLISFSLGLMRAQRFLVTAAICSLAISALAAARGFKWDSMVLYQPDDPLRARGVEAQGLSAYCKQLENVCTTFFASETTPERLDIVVGLKPGRKSRVWFISSRRTSQDKSLIALRKKLEAVPAYSVRGGPVAFALRCTIAGAAPSKEIPMPKEWLPKGGPVIAPDGVFEKIWRD
jgi:hypothetical protein